MMVFRNRKTNPFAWTLRRINSLGAIGEPVRPDGVRSTSRGIRTASNKSGFTLIEVLLAMAIIGLVLTPIFAIQLGVLRSNSRASQALARIFIGKQFLVENEFQLKPDEQEKRIERKIEKPATTLIYELKRVPENSALKKFKNILIESVTMQWVDRQGKKRQERLVSLVYKPEVKK